MCIRDSCYIYKWNRVQRVSRIRCTIFIQCMVGITVVYAADFYTEGIFSIELMSLANYVTVALEAGEMPVV